MPRLPLREDRLQQAEVELARLLRMGAAYHEAHWYASRILTHRESFEITKRRCREDTPAGVLKAWGGGGINA